MHLLLWIAIVLYSFNALAESPPPAVIGLRKAFANAYQSCESLRLRPLDRSSPDVEGIETLGRYPNSMTGHYVKITDAAAVTKTHYYIRESRPTPGCVNVQENQMIYDFGGKPNTDDDTLNYWKTSPYGSEGLGIDCSGFVFTALAVGGLRLKKGKPLRAKEVNQYPAKMYVHPKTSGFSCLAPKKMGVSGTLKPGDILASNYHVAMVESVGPDPFGIEKHPDCMSITYRDFDFVIAHSSPDKNNIGINKFKANDYLEPFAKLFFRRGLEHYARAACSAQKSGTNVVPAIRYFGVSEHKMTPECRQLTMRMPGESCISTCTEIFE